MKFKNYIEMINETNEKLNALEELKTKIMFAETDLRELKNISPNIQELLNSYINYIRRFDNFDDSE